MSEARITDEQLDRLRKLADAASPPPWRSMVEGRDHVSGDSFIMIGRDDDRDEDLYLSRDGGPASPADQDFIAAARNYIERSDGRGGPPENQASLLSAHHALIRR